MKTTQLTVARTLEEWVTIAATGDQLALQQVMVMIRPRLLSYCLSRMGGANAHAAEDVVQDVNLALLDAIPKYRDMGKPFMAFVYGIAAHKLADSARRSFSNRVVCVDSVPEGISSDIGPEQSAIAGEARQSAEQLMSCLNPKHRKIILMRVVWGMSAPQVAAELGMTAGAVRVAQHRAMNQLRAELGNFAALVA